MGNNESDKDSKDLDAWYETKFKPAVLSLNDVEKRIEKLEKISPEGTDIVGRLRLGSLVKMAEMSAKMANKEADFLQNKEKIDASHEKRDQKAKSDRASRSNPSGDRAER